MPRLNLLITKGTPPASRARTKHGTTSAAGRRRSTGSSNLFGEAPLIDGHREVQQRMSNPALNWLRDVALAVVRQRRVGRWLIAADLLEVILADGAIEMPGMPDGARAEDEAVRTTVLLQTGRRLGRAFGDADDVAIDRLRIERQVYQDDAGHDRRRYWVTDEGENCVPQRAAGREVSP
jgi:hypothetical protein